MRWRVAGLLVVTLLQPAVAEQRFVELGAGRGLAASIVNAMLIDRDGLLCVGDATWPTFEAPAFARRVRDYEAGKCDFAVFRPVTFAIING